VGRNGNKMSMDKDIQHFIAAVSAAVSRYNARAYLVNMRALEARVTGSWEKGDLRVWILYEGNGEEVSILTQGKENVVQVWEDLGAEEKELERRMRAKREKLQKELQELEGAL